MIETMRWFGPNDPVSLADIRQSGATGIVTALHDVPIDQAWSPKDVIARRDMISAAGLEWQVVESIPVHESIKQAGPDAAGHIDIWLQSMRAVAQAGLRTICYNFMPILDWTRTNLDYPLSNGATALRFDYTAIAAFDLFILRRDGAEDDYSSQRIKAAKAYFDALAKDEIDTLTSALIAGLPGMTGIGYDVENIIAAIAPYRDISNADLLQNLIVFQTAVAPVAEELGVMLAIHPDDPPRPILGMPRCASTRANFREMFAATPSRSNGLTWCLGALSSAVEEDAIAIGEDHADRIHFSHLRVVEKDAGDVESFQEAEHLAGDVSLVRAVDLLLTEEKSRAAKGENRAIPMRPDHGHRIAGDLKSKTNPGYGLYGRMKGLAELRGIAAGLRYKASTR